MAIRKIRISNFKSFNDLEIELGNFNVLIGANASGKSNFVQVFKFMRDIANEGLDNAISMQGGVSYLRNIRIGAERDFSVEVSFDTGHRLLVREEEKLVGAKIHEVIYKFGLHFRKKGLGFEIVEDDVTHKCEFVRVEIQKGKIVEREGFGSGQINVSADKGKIKLVLEKPGTLQITEERMFPPFLREERLRPRTLLLETPHFLLDPWENILSNLGIYDFDTKLPKKAVPITGKAELEEDGSNLALVLRNIVANRDQKRKFSNLLKDLLPFVADVSIEKFADKSLLFKLRETYFQNQYLPASLISDGTINVGALIVALYFEKEPLTIIEEHERNMHPYLISKVMSMIKDASRQKQIIVTTHNPEVVKHAGLENILLVSRNEEGFSTVTRPCESEEIRKFLENEIGIEELYVRNLLRT